MNNTLYILDGHGLIFRSYYAHIKAPLTNTKGENTSAVFGFFQTIRKIYTIYKPMYFMVALDSKGDTFRNTMYSEYKANRPKSPEDLISQIQVIADILTALEVPQLAVANMEADDIIASLVKKSNEQDISSAIITSDKDLFQLLDKKVSILRPTTKSSIWEKIDIQWLKDNWQLTPSQVRDYLAITGDSSDNVPGIFGIGKAGALKLLQEHQSLENVYKNIDSMKEVVRKKLIKNKDSAFLSYALVSLKNDIPVPDIQTLKHTDIAWKKAQHLFAQQDIFNFNKYTSAKTVSPHLTTPNSFVEEYPTIEYTSAKTVSHNYTLVCSEQQLHTLIQKITKAKLMSIDTETDTLDTITAVPVGISISITPHEGYYIPLKFPSSTHAHTISISEDYIKTVLQPLFDGSIYIVMHNAKFDLAVFENWGISCEKLRLGWQTTKNSTLFDTQVAAWMCMPNAFSYSMDDLSRQLLQYNPIPYNNLTDDNNTPISRFSDVPLPQACEYATEDSDITLQLYLQLSKTLKDNSIHTLFTTLEMPLLLLLQKIETHGLLLDCVHMQKISTTLQSAITQKENIIYELCGETFNINSTKQLQEILFTTLKLNPLKKNKTGFSTDIGVLEQLSSIHPVPREILNYRHLSKLKSTYTDALPQQIHPLTKRLHTSLQQTGTETGRISSTKPNLQNIPVKDEWGKEIRSAFISPQGYQFISADYSQIELMVLADLSQDKNMLEAFRNNTDIHSKTASILFSVDETNVTPELRRIAKTINFGVVYGMSAFRLSNALQISQKEAKAFIDAYFSEFSGITTFMAHTIATTKEKGFTTTIMGHKRPIINISSSNAHLRKAAERIAINTTIQGSAADIVKIAMLKVSTQLQEKNLTSKLILQIHDELLLECPHTEVPKILPLVKHSMEHAYTLSIPLKVNISTGNNWGNLK